MRWRVGKLEILEEDVLSSAEVGLVGSSFLDDPKVGSSHSPE